MTRNKVLLFATVSSLAAAMPALAQEAQPAAGTAAAPVTTGDIIVTAQRTSSLASKTPVAISAVTGDSLRSGGITNPIELSGQVPNVAINRGYGMQITIRGVTSSDTTEKGDPSAAFLVDGIYIARPQAQEVSFYDIARVEVLRGPQGTLYGRNTTAGVINIITNRPSHKFEAAANVGYGNYNAIQADAMINLPVSDTLALRFAGSFDQRDTYLYQEPANEFSGGKFKDNLSFRGQMLWEPQDNLSLLVIADYARLKGAGTMSDVDGTAYFTPSSTDPLATPATNELSSREARTRNIALQGDARTDDESYGVLAELNWDFGPLTMTYLGSYRVFEQYEDATNYYFGPLRAVFDATYKQQSHELRFALNDGGPLKLQFGGYYFDEKARVSSDSINGFGYASYLFTYNPVKAKSYAGFAQATYSLTDTLRATAGIRYSHDDKSRFGFTIARLGEELDLTNGADFRTLNASSISFSKVIWRAGLELDVDSRTLLYGTVSTGYKAGGFNDGCLEGSSTNGIVCDAPRPASQLYYQPETLTSYEVGLKTRTADNSLRGTLTGFYYDYKNLQLTSFELYQNAQSSITTNAGKARVWGVEAEATLSPSMRNRVDIAATYLNAEYTSYFAGADRVDFSGRPLDRSPKVTVTAAYTYTLPLVRGDTLAFTLRSRFSSEYYLTDFAGAQQFRQPSFTRTEATLTYTAPEERWYAQAYVRNLEDEVQISGVNNLGIYIVTPTDPLTFGGRVGVKF